MQAYVAHDPLKVETRHLKRKKDNTFFVSYCAELALQNLSLHFVFLTYFSVDSEWNYLFLLWVRRCCGDTWNDLILKFCFLCLRLFHIGKSLDRLFKVFNCFVLAGYTRAEYGTRKYSKPNISKYFPNLIYPYFFHKFGCKVMCFWVH